MIDIYFTENYGKIYERNNDGILKKYHYESKLGKVEYVFLFREVKINGFTGFYDISTPYGYGGPLFLGYRDEFLPNLISEFRINFNKYCIDHNIITEFIRFHPLLKNYTYLDNFIELNYIRDTVYMDLTSPELIWNNISSKCRNMIRKAEKNGIEIILDKEKNSIKEFYKLYTQTMDRNKAEKYYFFDESFFNNTLELLGENIFLFNAVYNKKIISSTLIMKYGDYIHYHFSGSDREFTNLAPNNLLLYKIALWGYENNCKYFHLGGGFSGNEDPLFKFKKSFSKNGFSKFYIGKKIHNNEIYDKLTLEWKKLKNINNIEGVKYFPIYRSDI